MSNYKDFDLKAVQSSASGMDAFFDENPRDVKVLASDPALAAVAGNTTAAAKLQGTPLKKTDLKRGLAIFQKDHPEYGMWVVLGPAAGTHGTWEVRNNRGSIAVDSAELERFWLKSEPKVASAGRRKVASVEDIKDFSRRSASTLVHKSEKDLWSLQKDAQGDYYIERMFDDQNSPIKG
jgi:hypothetical protein